MGPLMDGLRVITQGLQAEDWVVVNGIQRVRPDMKVDPQKETSSINETSGMSAVEKTKTDTPVRE
jgi:multidrug efflux system membrane fusion protein